MSKSKTRVRGETNVQNANSVQSTNTPTKPSAGRILRTAREAAQVDIAELAAILKVPVAKLEALEADRSDLLQDVAFARALTASVCRNLKIEATPVLEQLPGLPLIQPQVKVPSRQIFESSSEKIGVHNGSHLLRPLPLAIGCLLLAIVILILLPYIQTSGLVPTSSENQIAPTTQEPEPDTTRSGDLSVDGLNVLSLPAGVIAESIENAPSQMATSVSNLNAKILNPAINSEPLALNALQIPAAVAAKDVLVLSTTVSSWVQVTDDKGAIIINTTLQPGTPVSVKRTVPLAVVVGRADVTQVWVRGQSFDIAPFAKKNVARFEVR